MCALPIWGRAAGQPVGVCHAAHDTLWALVERARLAVRPRPAQVAERCTAQFDAVEPRALGQRQIILLAAFDIDIPVGQREIAVASRQARSVVAAGPGSLGAAVPALPTPFLPTLRLGQSNGRQS